LCEKENNIKDQECKSYYEGLRIYFHGIEPIIRKNGLTSLKLEKLINVPTLIKSGAISQVHSIGAPISEKEGHFFYEVIDTPKKMALSKGLYRFKTMKSHRKLINQIHCKNFESQKTNTQKFLHLLRKLNITTVKNTTTFNG
jgi:hypothetical protein